MKVSSFLGPNGVEVCHPSSEDENKFSFRNAVLSATRHQRTKTNSVFETLYCLPPVIRGRKQIQFSKRCIVCHPSSEDENKFSFRNAVFPNYVEPRTEAKICIMILSVMEHRQISLQSVRFEVFAAVTKKNGVFWDVTLCGYYKNRRFGGS
jgi:hypothetical protein